MSKTADRHRTHKHPGASRPHTHAQAEGHSLLPSDVSDKVGPFDRFAKSASELAGRAVFFSFCVLVIVLWAPTIFFMKFDTSQLLINTTTTIITFLMVALIQNSQSRADKAVQHKLNAIADSLADHIETSGGGRARAKKDAAELREAVGLEYVESSDGD